VIGFVSAGLVKFPQAVAVVLGANLGTTGTTWLVALLGFKVKISAAALPMLGVGAFFWLLGKGRVRAGGMVLAGFGLLFTGIEYLQGGMAGVEWRLEGLAGEGLGTRWMLAGIGVLMTVVMQSSSAAGATTLVALGAGTLTLDQGFAIMVGQNLGTTVTAALASIGGGVAVKRTALAHVLFNAVTGVSVLILLGPFGFAARWLGELAGDSEGVLSLAAFHTLFNLFGVLMFYPWVAGFARMIERMTGRGAVKPASRLDGMLEEEGGGVALEGAWRALFELAREAFGEMGERLEGRRGNPEELAMEVRRVRDFMGRLRMREGDQGELAERRVMIWHAVDHLLSLSEDLLGSGGDGPLSGIEEETRRMNEALVGWCAEDSGPDSVGLLESASLALAEARRVQRVRYLQDLADGKCDPAEAMAGLERIRWVDGASYHAWRLADALESAAAKRSV
jgi:phosphate:Na+ symporter